MDEKRTGAANDDPNRGDRAHAEENGLENSDCFSTRRFIHPYLEIDAFSARFIGFHPAHGQSGGGQT
jgi:hypothetical protein